MTRQRINLDEPLWENEMRAVSVGGKNILLIRKEACLYAYEDRCLHKGVPLSRGKLEGETLTCFAHHWTYNICTGQGLNPAHVHLKQFSVQEQEGEVWIEID